MVKVALPSVTIVTPSYNQGRFIRETIESVLSQDYPRLEHVVVDGGSTDETISILKSYGQQLTWVSEPDRGQAHAINKGWKLARGEILAWLNSDDMYLPGAVSKAVNYLVNHPQVGMVYGEGYHIAESGTVIGRFPTESFIAERLKETCFIFQPAAFMRRSVIEAVGFLNESLSYCMDYDLWIRVSQKYDVGYFPEYLAQVRLHEGCKTVRQRAASYKETVEMLRSHFGYAPPSWVCGYAFRLLETHLGYSRLWQKVAFLPCLAGLAAWNLIRYSRQMPLSQVRGLGRAVRVGIRKFLWGDRTVRQG